jgi:threonine/homoserine/homoserine lactone efflux protein
MTFATWLTVLSICALGAMSPGASLAVVLRHTLKGGRRNGSIAAITHGAGLGLYALLCISGLAFLITTSPRVFSAFQWAGAAYLVWLGIRGILTKAQPEGIDGSGPTGRSAARDGFLIVFLNPQIAVFFIALFSQVIGPDTTLPERLVYASTAWLTDTAWYLLVAWMFSHPRWIRQLQARAVWLERLFGAILLALAVRLVLEALH